MTPSTQAGAAEWCRQFVFIRNFYWDGGKLLRDFQYSSRKDSETSSFVFQFQYHNFEDTVQGFYLGFFVLGGESILKKNFEPHGGEKKCFRPSRGVRGHAPPKHFEKTVFRIG